MPLNDDPDAMSDEEYNKAWQERIARAGDNGLHTIPEKYLTKDGSDGEDR